MLTVAIENPINPRKELPGISLKRGSSKYRIRYEIIKRPWLILVILVYFSIANLIFCQVFFVSGYFWLTISESSTVRVDTCNKSHVFFLNCEFYHSTSGHESNHANLTLTVYSVNLNLTETFLKLTSRRKFHAVTLGYSTSIYIDLWILMWNVYNVSTY